MILHFNATGERRKELVKVIENSMGIKAKYLGMPSAAYQIGEYTVTRDGALTWGDMVDADSAALDQTSSMIDAGIITADECTKIRALNREKFYPFYAELY